MKKRYLKQLTILGVGITIIIIIIITLSIYTYYNLAIKSAVKQTTYIYIPTGATYDDVVDSIRTKGILHSIDKFELVAMTLSYPERVKSGRYEINDGMSYRKIVETLRRGGQRPVRITFNNIRTLEQLAGKITANIELDSTSILKSLMADSIHDKYHLNSNTFISMFIPNTYEVYWNISAGALIERMNLEYTKFWNEERLAKLDTIGLSRMEATTLASIVYEESKMRDEFPVVAGVYMNRLKIGMPLQADPTIKFAVGDFTLRRVLNTHLSVKSPYNTYKQRGLPPGPICIPSIEAIDGVLEYEKHEYIYFCAAPELSGYHKFAKTLSEHNRNAREYHRALNKLKIFN